MQSIKFSDSNAFILGNLAPDAPSETEGRYVSHFRIVNEDGSKTLDLEAFRKEYLEGKTDDAFAIGYYCHLIADLIYRRIMYHEHFYSSEQIRKSDNLYRDYHLINGILIHKYGLAKIDEADERCRSHKLTACFNLNLNQLLNDLNEDFKDKAIGEPVYFTQAIAKEVIESASLICIEEIKSNYNNKENQQKLNICW